MRQYGIPLSRIRRDWCRFPCRPARIFDLCEFLARVFPGVPFAECGAIGAQLPPDFQLRFGTGVLPFAPGPMPRFPEPVFSFIGPGCPQILSQLGWVGQDPFGVGSLQSVGVPFGDAARPIRFGYNGPFIVQTRWVRDGVFDARRCDLGLSEAEGRAVVAVWDALSLADLQANGFT